MLFARCIPATESLPPTIVEEMEEMFLRLGFSQTVAMKLVDDQEIFSSKTLASLSDKDIAAICNVIRRPDGLVSGKMPERGNQISILAAKNLKLTAFIIQLMKCCSRSMTLSLSTPYLCCKTRISGIWNRRKQTMWRDPE